jgi:beta-barrel assembly-enhancing protease
MNAADRRAAELSRRGFLRVTAASAAAAVTGCATNPVSGRRQFMLVSESQEVAMDRRLAGQQFSSDYGVSQDAELNAYISEVGMALSALTQRPHMPYTFQVVNTVVVNGYTFPGGSVGLARGLLLEMKTEAELAAVLGHELGHVNARHAAERLSKSLVASLALAGVAEYVRRENEEYADLAAGLGGIGAGLLLSRYSRDDEREADALGMTYMTQGGYTPMGMVTLMDTFRALQKGRPNVVATLFATHPMNDERYRTARAAAETRHADALAYPDWAERYLDRTASVRRLRGAIEHMQKGGRFMAAEEYGRAEPEFLAALREAPEDYAGLLMTAACYLNMGRKAAARPYIERARAVYPGEPLAEKMLGIAELAARNFDAALAGFQRYEQALPGNPDTRYYMGRALEGMGRRRDAAQQYMVYRNAVSNGGFAGYVDRRLAEWGYQPR